MLKNLYMKYKSMIIYLVCGVTTTIINFAAYNFFTRICHIEFLISNAIAFVIAVLSAYILNKQFVFDNHDYSFQNIKKELSKFFSLRILGLVFETGGLWLFVQVFHFNDNLIKLIISVIIVIMNYIISKFFVFK